MSDTPYTFNDFWDAILANQPEKVDAMLGQNPEWVNQPDVRGFPPIILAAYRNQVDLLKVFNKHGVDMNDVDTSDNTALMGAVFKGNQECVDWLLENGADPNHQTPMEMNALTYAIENDREEAFKSLLKHGADLEMSTPSGKTIAERIEEKGPEWAQKIIG